MKDEKIRVCVIDDEPIACRKIQRLLKEDPEVEIVATCANGEEGLAAILNHKPDLVFLDIQMPEMNGFEMLQSIHMKKMPYVVFVTAYDSYAIQAFRVHALDYLLKPFDKNEFQAALRHAKLQVQQDRDYVNNRDLKALLREVSAKPGFLDRLVVKARGKIYFLRVEDIDWIEAQGKYELVHAGKESHLIREGMNKLEAGLDPRKFVRIHKSAIVNVDRIEHLQPLFHSDYRAVLRNGTALTISRRYRAKLEAALGREF